MKQQFKKIIFAAILGISAMSANQTFAANNLPMVGNHDEFSNFVRNKAYKFSKENIENFKKYNEVVELYNLSNVAFFKLDETQQSDFSNASQAILKSLNNLNNAEAKLWANKIKLNQSIFEFIWASKTENNLVSLEIPNSIK